MGLEYATGATSPSVVDVITFDGAPQDLSGSSALFKMRLREGSATKVSAAATVVSPQTGTNKGKVQYDWAPTDLDTEGEYVAWWVVTLPGGRQVISPLFEIGVDNNLTPGDDVLVGPIAYEVRGIIPIAYDALMQDARVGEAVVQRKIDLTKYKLFGTIVNPAMEATVYNPLVLNYAGKIAAIQIIPAAIDYWMVQPFNVSATGTNENASFPNRIDALWKIHERLLAEVKQDADLVDDWVINRRKDRGPLVSTAGLPFKSENPQDFYNQGRDDPPGLANGPAWLNNW